MKRTVLVLLGTLAVTVPAAGAPVIAVQDDAISNDPDPAVIDQRLTRLAQTDAKWTRLDIDWSKVAVTRPRDPRNPADPAYDWTMYDRIVVGLHRRGTNAMVTLLGTPAWATPSGRWNAAPPPGPGSDFAAAVARRYNGTYPDPSGSGVLPAIRSLSPRNEPNIDMMTTPQCRRAGTRWVPVSPLNYARLLRATYPKVKAVAPKIVVVAGETAAADNGGCKNAGTTIGTHTFFRQLTRALGKGKPPFDAWAQHMHSVGPPGRAAFFPSWTTLSTLTRELDALRPGRRMPVIISETSYATSYSPYHRYFVTEAQQAAWMQRSFQLARKNPNVVAVVYFNLQDHRDWPAGLYRSDWTAKPALAAFRRWARQTPLPQKWAPIP